jgi:hypothetical protein
VSRREVIECDRCGDPVGDSTEDRENAGRLYAATLSCVDRVGTSVTPADLCGPCLTDLVLFMGGRSLERPGEAKAAKVTRERV